MSLETNEGSAEHQEGSAASLLQELKDFVLKELESLKGLLHHGAVKPDGSAVNVHSLIDQAGSNIEEAHAGLAYYAERVGPAPDAAGDVPLTDEELALKNAAGDLPPPVENTGNDPAAAPIDEAKAVESGANGVEPASNENGANS